jgi:hypothetical protein
MPELVASRGVAVAFGSEPLKRRDSTWNRSMSATNRPRNVSDGGVRAAEKIDPAERPRKPRHGVARLGVLS